MKNFKLPKWVVVIVAAAIFLPLMADCVVPGLELRLAIDWLEGEGRAFPLWGRLVRLAGYDIAALGAISAVAGLACVWCVASIAANVVRAAVRVGEKGGFKGANEFAGVEAAAVVLAGLGFAIAPGMLKAATRVSPLMVVLVPILSALAIVSWIAFCGKGSSVLVNRFGQHKGALCLALLLLGVALFEFLLSRKVYLQTVAVPLAVGFACSVLPALILAGCVRMRYLVNRYAQLGAYAAWAVVAVMFATTSSVHDGRDGNRIVAQIVADAAGRSAILAEGPIDDILSFTRPEGLMRISMSREDDPAYGRELADWVRDISRSPESKANGGGLDSSCKDSVQVEDLAFAAELGPRVLVDEWAKLDREGFEAAVASPVNFFPTRERLESAAEILKGMREDDPFTKDLRQLLGVCGNALGCRLVEKGDAKGAWDVLWTVCEKVDRKNYAALVNLSGLIDRGQAVSKTEAEIVRRRHSEVEAGLKDRAQAVRALRAGGRVYVAPETKEAMAKLMRETVKRRGYSPETQRFIAAVTNALKDRAHGEAAQKAIRNAIWDGRLGITDIGGQLIAIDLALGDGASMEKDALALLKADRRNPTANAMLGMIAGSRGDHERAERYLKRAMASGKASLGAKNDYAYTLMKLGRLDEAEPYAREAVKGYGEHWASRETLAAILIRKGKIEEGERELAKAEELAAKAGAKAGSLVSLEIDRALLLKAKGDMNRFKIKVRSLRRRQDLTDGQRAEVEELGRASRVRPL